jgi:hypothetical protein
MTVDFMLTDEKMGYQEENWNLKMSSEIISGKDMAVGSRRL